MPTNIDETELARLEYLIEASESCGYSTKSDDPNMQYLAAACHYTPALVTEVRRLREKGARITLGDDAHAPDHLGPYVALAVEHARQAGYRTVWYMDAERKWRELPLDEVG